MGTVSRRLKFYLAQKRQYVSGAVSARSRAVGSINPLGLTEEWTECSDTLPEIIV